jgi:hypothetical protein
VRIASSAVVLAVVSLAVCSSAAHASQTIGSNAANVRLAVNANREALVTYTAADGRVRRVLAWGALDAVPPATDVSQERFRLDTSGGWGRYRSVGYWRRFRNVCGRYTGPPLVYGVASCTAPDGTHWALQSWQRIQPLRGVAAFRPEHMSFELHLSHWSTPLAVLEVSPNWTYGGTLQGLFGRLWYAGRPVHGFRTPSRSRVDLNARFVYIDTLDSAYGPGWKRGGAKVTHVGTGGFCYSFAPLANAPAGYAAVPTVSGVGQRHRVTAMGPGVTPDVVWEGPALSAYDPQADAAFDALFDAVLGADTACRTER